MIWWKLLISLVALMMPAAPPTIDRDPPTVAILAPDDGEVLVGQFAVTAGAWDDGGIMEIRFMTYLPDGSIVLHN